MTLIKRKVLASSNYIHPEFLDRAALESTSSQKQQNSILQDANFGELTGVLSQVGHLAAYTMELLDGLFRIAQETQSRIEKVTERTVQIQLKFDQLEQLETKKRNANANKTNNDDYNSSLVNFNTDKSKFSHAQLVKVPNIFTRITNDDPIQAQYLVCEPPPALRRFDALLGGKQCMQQYSYPGFFFQQWVRSETERQKKIKDEKRAKKKAKKEARVQKDVQENKSKMRRQAQKRRSMEAFAATIKKDDISGMPIAKSNVQIPGIVPPPPAKKDVSTIPKAVPPPPPLEAYQKRKKRASVVAQQIGNKKYGRSSLVGRGSGAQRSSNLPPKAPGPLSTVERPSNIPSTPPRRTLPMNLASAILNPGSDERVTKKATEMAEGTTEENETETATESVADSEIATSRVSNIVEAEGNEKSRPHSMKMSPKSLARPLSVKLQQPPADDEEGIADEEAMGNDSIVGDRKTLGDRKTFGDRKTLGDVNDGELKTEADADAEGGQGAVEEEGRETTATVRTTVGEEVLVEDDVLGEEEEEKVPEKTQEEIFDEELQLPQYSKYRMMKQINLPEGAIRLKMETDNISDDLIDHFCPNTIPLRSVRADSLPSQIEDEEDEGDAPVDDGNWEESIDEETGAKYYVNRVTWESSWVAPQGWNKKKKVLGSGSAGSSGDMFADIKKGVQMRRISVTPGSRPVIDPRMDLMSQLKGGAKLKKAAPLEPKPMEARDVMLMKLKGGLKDNLRKVETKTYKAEENMDEAVAQLLANRHAIAGDESDSDSESDYEFDSDDDYP